MSKKLIFSSHAKDRCAEYGLNYRQVKDAFKRAKRTWPPDYVRKINKDFHNRASKGIFYLWANGILYTCVPKGNANIVLTVALKKREDVEFA